MCASQSVFGSSLDPDAIQSQKKKKTPTQSRLVDTAPPVAIRLRVVLAGSTAAAAVRRPRTPGTRPLPARACPWLQARARLSPTESERLGAGPQPAAAPASRHASVHRGQQDRALPPGPQERGQRADAGLAAVLVRLLPEPSSDYYCLSRGLFTCSC